MKIVYIGGEPIPGNAGGSVHFMEAACGLVKLGHCVLAIVPAMDKFHRKEVYKGLNIIRVPMIFKGKTFTIASLKAWKDIKCFEPDIILERFVTFGGTGALFSKKFGTKLVLEVNSPHTDELIYRLKIKNRFLKKILMSWRNFQFNHCVKAFGPLKTIVPDEKKFVEMQWAANCDLFDKKFINPNLVKKLKEKIGLSDEPVIVFLGTFRNWHGVNRLPDIVNRVTKRIHSAKFLLIGTGNECENVKNKFFAMGLDKSVILTGQIDYKDVPLYLSLAQIGIAPYDRTAYPPLLQFGFYWSPLKIFEYMSAGLPVVTIDINPLNKIVADNERGYLVTENDWDLFADKIIYLLKNKENCNKMGESACLYVKQHYSWPLHVNQLNELLLTLVKD
ncbi:glycosyltransferase family 4 protein [bacterium]|nr:glycosyltransferase family 4 protein [bacterium]